MNKFVLFSLLLISVIGRSQINPNTNAPDVFLANPQASRLLNYKESQISSYTGSDNIIVPIYTLETKAIDIPISLIYQTGGIKVIEEAGWVGLGWQLSTEMEVIQTVVGLDDFGYYGNRSFPNYECLIPLQSSGLTASSVMSQQNVFFLGFDDNWNAQNPGCFYDPAYFAGIKDSEPDIFHFNALGYSGKFMLDWASGEFKCLTNKKVVVEAPNYNGSPGNTPYMFILHFPDGNKFKFELKEETSVSLNETKNESTGVTMGSNVDWINRNEKTNRVYKLTEIISNKADLIEFEYTINPNESVNFPYINESFRTYVPYTGSNLALQNDGKLTSYLATKQQYSYLSAIKYEDIRIDFLNSPRIDLKESMKLDKIQVKFKEIIKDEFTFDYSYFISNENSNNWTSLLNYSEYFVVDKAPEEITHRLKLDAFHGVEEEPYVFIYEDLGLPVKTSYATDYWGYYNGYDSNISFMPNIYRFNIQMCNESYTKFEQNNRSSDLNYAKAGSLKKIKYPTGGATEYKYELNSFSNYKAPNKDSGGGKMFLEISTGNGNPNVYNQAAEVIENDCIIMEGSALLSTRGCDFSQLYDKTYIKIERFSEELIPTVKNAQYGYLYGLSLIGVFSDPAVYNTYIEDVQYIQMKYDDPEEKIINDLELTLEKGIYVFTAYGGCGTYNGTVNSSQASLTVHYRKYDQLSESALSYGAGLRISEIKKMKNDYTPAIVKRFDYEGGKLMTPLIIFNQTQVKYEQHKVYSIQGAGCDPYYQSQLAMYNMQKQAAWNMFINHPNQSTASAFNSINDQIDALGTPSNCDKIIGQEYFHGLKNELFSGNVIQPSLIASGRYVGYDKVIEFSIDSGSDNGRVEYYFLNNPDEGAPQNNQGDGYFTEVNVPLAKNYPENGLLEKKEVFDSSGNKLKSVINSFEKDISSCYWGAKILATDVDSGYTPTQGIMSINNYLHAVYPMKMGESRLSETQTTNYFEGNVLTSVKEYLYDDFNQVKVIKEYNSKGEIIEVLNQYVYDDLGKGSHQGMINRHYITPIIKSYRLLDVDTIQVESLDYSYVNTSNYINAYMPYSFKSGRDERNLINSLTIHRYDKRSNPIEYSKLDGVKVVMLWGYNGIYPIAKIENATYQEVLEQLVGHTNLGDYNESDMDQINDLRINLPEAMITTYEYNPLVGISKIIDPKNVGVMYQYDKFNRLEFVLDFEGNIIRENEYHYKNQQ